jgi:hypothetical protein
MDEPSLIRLFTNITGEGESNARCVMAYLDLLRRDYFPDRRQVSTNGETNGHLQTEAGGESFRSGQAGVGLADPGQLFSA